MPVWPKFVYTINGSLRTAATQRKLRRSDSGGGDQVRAFNALTRRLAGTSYWKAAGIEEGMSYAQFQTRVPVHTYAALTPAFERMQAGEADVLWPGRCTLFGLTAGTSTLTPKCLPMTDGLLAHFRRAGLEALLYYTARAGRAAFHGRHLYCNAPTDLAPLGSKDAFVGEVGGIAMANLPEWAQRHFYEAGPGPSDDPANEEGVRQLSQRTASRDITLIAGLPNAVTGFIRLLRSHGQSKAPLQQRWPNLDCLVHTGAAVAPYAHELRRRLGNQVTFHEVYAAAEGMIAAQDAEPARGLRVMPDMGVFFEFVPLADYDDIRLEQLGPRSIPLADVKPQIDYVVLLTTPGGLARYVLGDVVRFASVKPPRLFHIGGTELRLNALQENVSERELTEALAGLCQRREWTIVNFHVAPLFAPGNLTGQRRGSHEWWVELRPGTVITPTGPQIGMELDASLREISPSYAARRSAGFIDMPVVRLVMPGVFEHWLRFHRKWGGQHKMPRCRSDRIVADEFAQMTNFARD